MISKNLETKISGITPINTRFFLNHLKKNLNCFRFLPTLFAKVPQLRFSSLPHDK